jgi:hypothetical protein
MNFDVDFSDVIDVAEMYLLLAAGGLFAAGLLLGWLIWG